MAKSSLARVSIAALVGMTLLSGTAFAQGRGGGIGGGRANGPACEERKFELPGLPPPHFRDVLSYETVIPSSTNDVALVVAPEAPYGLRQAGVQFPAVVVLQGGSVAYTSYSDFAERLARHGYVVIVPHHVIQLGPQRGPFTNVRVINQAFDHLKAETARAGSPIEGLVDVSKLGVVGHSLGGATALQAVGKLCLAPLCFGVYAPPPELAAVAVYGGNMRNRPPAVGFIDVNNIAPVVMIHGSQDGIAKIADARTTYGLLEESKTFLRINGASHYGITNTDNSGGTPDAPPAIGQDVSVAAIADSTALYFDVEIKSGGLLAPALECFSQTKDGLVSFED